MCESTGSLSLESLAATVAKVFGSNEKIEPTIPLTQLGLDSLMAVELSSTLKKTYGIRVTQMELLGGLTIAKILEKAEAGGQ